MNYIVGRQYRTLVLGNILASAIKQAVIAKQPVVFCWPAIWANVLKSTAGL
jgi:hypothetical protein